MKLINDLGKTADQVRDNWYGTNGETGAHIDEQGVVRWNVNAQIPFQDMLADFRTLGLIDEDVQLYSNLLREKETDEFWEGYFNKMEKEKI
jgi:hypothetical protein